jgi:hypothetical protein
MILIGVGISCKNLFATAIFTIASVVFLSCKFVL